MAIKVDMTSADVDRQLALLHFYPEVMKKHFRSRLFQAVRGLQKHIVGTIPRKSRNAANTFGSRVVGTGINMKGQVGWYDKSDPWYPNVLEHGAKPHQISAKDNSALFFGEHAYRIVHHPGLSARGFMAAGYSAMKPQIEESMRLASEAVVAEMAVP